MWSGGRACLVEIDLLELKGGRGFKADLDLGRGWGEAGWLDLDLG